MLLVFLLAVAAASVSGAEQQPQPQAWLDPPVAVADNRALRLDVQTSSILLRAQVIKLVVCSAVDQPLVAYDAARADTTGCASPGFMATHVYPASGPEQNDELFRVRQRARSLFIKRRLLEPHSPTVWMQATLEVPRALLPFLLSLTFIGGKVRDERGIVLEPAERVVMVRFQVPERALAIGQTLPPPPPASMAEELLKFFNMRGGDVDSEGHDVVVVDYDLLDAREDLHNGTSTTYRNGVHWMRYSAVLLGAMSAAALVIVGLVRCISAQHRQGRKARGRALDDPLHHDDGGDSTYTKAHRQRLARMMEQARARGLYSDDLPGAYDNLA